MASAWGLSFGSAWGNAWGLISEKLQPTGAVSYDKKKRRKNIVNVDGVLYEFESELEAISFLNLQEENNDPVAEKITKPVPVKTVNIETVESLSESAIISATPNQIYNYIQFADYAAIIKAYDQWLELDEEEALLLLM